MADTPFPRRTPSIGVAPTYTIFIRDFTAPVTVAGTPGQQTARFNLTLTVAHPGAGFPDDIAAVMSYEDIVNDLRALCAGEAVPGAEDLAERAASLCLERAKVRKVRVEVELRAADPDTIVTGVTLTRESLDERHKL